MNNGRPLKRITPQMMETDDGNESNLLDLDSIIFPVLERQDNQQSILGLEVNSLAGQGGIDNIRIYQERVVSI